MLQGVLEAVSEEGGAVVYASHLVHDIERVADNVVFLDAGKKRFEAPVEQLKETMRRARAVFENGAPDAIQLDGRIDVQSEGRVLDEFLVSDGTGWTDLRSLIAGLDGEDVWVAWGGPNTLIAKNGTSNAVAEARSGATWKAVLGRWP